MATVSAAAEHGAPPSRPPVARRTRCRVRPYCVRYYIITKSAPRLSVAAVASRACLFLRSRPSRRPRAYHTIYNRVFLSPDTRRPPSAFWRAPYKYIVTYASSRRARPSRFPSVPANLVPRDGLPVHRSVHHHNDTSARRAAEVRRVAAVRCSRPGRRMSGRR